jgi:hypothetical protein
MAGSFRLALYLGGILWQTDMTIHITLIVGTLIMAIQPVAVKK